MKIAAFAGLCTGFGLLFTRIRWLHLLRRYLHKSRASLEEAARKRGIESRRNLLRVEKEYSLWLALEQRLGYAGFGSRLPNISPELWLAGNVVLAAGGAFALLTLSGSLVTAFGGVSLLLTAEYFLIYSLRTKNLKSVNDNLLKLLDFLGSYSITAGEITGIFNQISKYMDEPLKSALEEYCCEAQTTGDVNLALLSLADKVEHPKFKELMQNLEVSIRYCADFTALVNGSRKSMREYLRSQEERKSLLREGGLNMLLLLGLSTFVLFMVDKLIAASVWQILFHTVPGRLCIGVLFVIFVLFVSKIGGLRGR